MVTVPGLEPRVGGFGSCSLACVFESLNFVSLVNQICGHLSLLQGGTIESDESSSFIPATLVTRT
jgi:hypothetical protein